MNRFAFTAALLLGLQTVVFAQYRTTYSTYNTFGNPPPDSLAATYRMKSGYTPISGVSFSDVDPPAGTSMFGAPIPTIPYAAQAVVTMTFPATAEVWLNGEKCNGSDRVWTFTSPTLPGGTAYLFDIRARWKIDGKTYETERSVAAMSGNRSRSTVVSGRFILE